MIIWSGYGIVVPLIVGVVSFLSGVVAGFVGEEYAQSGVSIGLILSAVVVWFVGKQLNGRPGRILVDPKTGEEVDLRPATSSLFFIPMQWWAPLIAVAGFALMLGGLD
jgi:hypothetical protein